MYHEAQRRDLCEKIARWRSEFKEGAVITGIVMPILQLAGYDTYNPEEVLLQSLDDTGGIPDLMVHRYSAISGAKEPRCIIEVKALSVSLIESHLRQVKSYFRLGASADGCLEAVG